MLNGCDEGFMYIIRTFVGILLYHLYTDILEDMTKNQNVLDLAHSDSHLYTHLRATHSIN